MTKRPQWSRILRSAVDGIAAGVHSHKAYQLAGGRVHLWARISGDVIPSTPSYNELVDIITNKFALEGYAIDAENRKLDVDIPIGEMGYKGSGRWVAEIHIYLFAPA